MWFHCVVEWQVLSKLYKLFRAERANSKLAEEFDDDELDTDGYDIEGDNFGKTHNQKPHEHATQLMDNDASEATSRGVQLNGDGIVA